MIQAVNTTLVQVSEVVGIGKVEPENEIISLASSAGGIVNEIYKGDGDTVRKDEIILRLDDELERIRVAQLRSQLNTLRTQKDMEELSLKETEVKLDNRSRLLASVRALVQQGAETEQGLDDLEAEVSVLALNAEKGRASVRLAGERLAELEEQLRYSEAQAERKIMRSPFDGLLLDIHATKGSAVEQFSTYAEMAPSGSKVVRAEVDELFADRLREGLQAEIRYVGSDLVVATGKLDFLSPYLKRKSLFSDSASEQEDRLVREVRVRLDGPTDLILNARVECVIKL